MYSYKVVICGCTKNSEQYIEKHLELLYGLGSIFEKCNIIVYENDSEDETKEKLKSFKRTHTSFEFISENGIANKLKHRPLIIAHSRNTLMKYIDERYNNYDMIIMVDLDKVICKFNINVITNTLDHYKYDSWDVLTGNCDGKYYDIWALRICQDMWDIRIHQSLWKNGPIDYDCWLPETGDKNPQYFVYDNQVHIPTDYPLIPVNSAFNGIGIYKMKAVKNCRYSAIDDKGIITCEHVSFHKKIKELNNGRIFICPKLLIYNEDHYKLL